MKMSVAYWKTEANLIVRGIRLYPDFVAEF